MICVFLTKEFNINIKHSRHITFGRSVPKHKTSRRERYRPRKVSSYGKLKSCLHLKNNTEELKLCLKIFFAQQSVKNCFIRGSVVRYVQLPADEIDTQLLQDAARKEALQNTAPK